MRRRAFLLLALVTLVGCGSSGEKSGRIVNPNTGRKIVVPAHCVTLPGPHKTLCGAAAIDFCKSSVGMYGIAVGMGSALDKSRAVADAEALRKMCLGVGVNLAGHRLSKNEETSTDAEELKHEEEAREAERTVKEHRAEPPAQKQAEIERYAQEAYRRLEDK